MSSINSTPISVFLIYSLYVLKIAHTFAVSAATDYIYLSQYGQDSSQKDMKSDIEARSSTYIIIGTHHSFNRRRNI